MLWNTNHARRLSAAMLGLTLLAGCGGSGDAESAPSGPAPDVLVRAAADETTDAGSSRFALSITTAKGAVAGEGAYDYAKKVGQLSLGTIELRIIGSDLYIRPPKQPDALFKVPASDIAGTDFGNSTDPIAFLRALNGVGTVAEVGTERVRDVETTHYAGEYDVAQSLAMAEGTAKVVLESTLKGAAVQRVPFDAYLDEQGRMVKFEQRLELAASAKTDGQPLTSTLMIEFFDFGTTVSVVAPPAEMVREDPRLADALNDRAPQPPGPAAPAPAPPAPPAPAPAPPGAVAPAPPVGPAPPVPPAPVPPAPVPAG